MADDPEIADKLVATVEQSADYVLWTLEHGRPEVKARLSHGIVADALKALARSEDDTDAAEKKRMQEAVFKIARKMQTGGLSEKAEAGKEPEPG